MESMERTGRTDATEYTTIGAFRSANVHLTSCCNYRCGFCFSTKLDKRWLSANEWVPILEKFRHSGICKINYAGGEPFLYPEIAELCKVSKRMGFKVSIVSNASLIDEYVLSDLEGSLDWLGLSVDSISEDTERKLGRDCNGGNHIENVVSVADMAHRHKISVKLNITVVRQSVEDDFTDLICRIDPQRVKVFQMLSLRNVNPDADALYQAGIRASFAFSGADGVDAYLQNPKVILSSDKAEALKQIVMQRFLAGFLTDGIEAWSDWRRYNIPELPIEPGQADVGITVYPYRMQYSDADKQYNVANAEAAIRTYLNGDDSRWQRVWWDVADND